jgi:hypothetical protein
VEVLAGLVNLGFGGVLLTVQTLLGPEVLEMETTKLSGMITIRITVSV